MWKKETKKVRTCPRCSTEFESSKCPACQWTPEENKTTSSQYCSICHAGTVHKYKGQWLCIGHFEKQWGDDYEFSATPDQIARFLITKGSKSLFWKHARKEWQDHALSYYKAFSDSRDKI